MSVTITCQVTTGVAFAVAIVFILFPLTLPPWARGRHVTLNYVLVPPLCVLTLFLSSCLSIDTLWAGIRGTPGQVEPYSILLLLYGLAYGCISLDVSGVLKWVAVKLASSNASNPKRLFGVVFCISSIFTILTSNDVVILTLTPIVCTLCESLQLEPQVGLLFVVVVLRSYISQLNNWNRSHFSYPCFSRPMCGRVSW